MRVEHLNRHPAPGRPQHGLEQRRDRLEVEAGDARRHPGRLEHVDHPLGHDVGAAPAERSDASLAPGWDCRTSIRAQGPPRARRRDRAELRQVRGRGPCRRWRRGCRASSAAIGPRTATAYSFQPSNDDLVMLLLPKMASPASDDLDLHVLAAPQPALHPARRRVDRHRAAVSLQPGESSRQRRPLAGRHQHAAQALAERVDEQRDRDAAPLRRAQRRQQRDAVAVVLEVEGGEIQKRPRCRNHREAPVPFRRAIPERHERRCAGHQSR